MYEPYQPDYEHKRNVCIYCKYSKAFNHYASLNKGLVNVYCDYLLMTRSLRPCPAAECTVFEPRPVNNKRKRGPGIII